MHRWTNCLLRGVTAALLLGLAAPAWAELPDGSRLDTILNRENDETGVTVEPAPIVDDLAYLRRVSVDLIGRIPTDPEIQEYLAWPSETRRQQVVDKLLEHERFADRWTAFFADMLRLRSNAEGGTRLMAFVHNAVEEGMPYDVLARRLISAGGKSGAVPEVGFILGDNADPMALAGITSQVFMGVRMACAECHDHPFDKWTRKDFYSLAAYFGKTRRVERRFQDRVLATYTTEAKQSTVLWPPEGIVPESERDPVEPTFPVSLVEPKETPDYIARLKKLRESQRQQVAKAEKKPSKGSAVEDLLASAAERAERETDGEVDTGLGVVEEARQAVQEIDVKTASYRPSELREQLARLVTSPRNRYFSRSFVNRVWKELIGIGFVEPIDDFSDNNPPHHPETLDYLANEFVAHGYDLRTLIHMIVTSEAYQRGHAVGVDEATRQEMQQAFLATPLRRMISEALYDSIVTAGHLFDVKHEAGKNMKIVWRQTRVMKKSDDAEQQKVEPKQLAEEKPAADDPKAMKKKKMAKKKPASGYDLEKAIELDFDNVLAKSEEGVEIEKMQAMSAEEIEARRMMAQQQRQEAEYYDRFVRTEFDDNPRFGSAFRMASPAPAGHFLRVFGQPGRQELGDFRDHSASMRQQLMILNGRLTHEASRVGELEPIYSLLVGEQADLEEAIRLAYRELLTREPSATELADARRIVDAADGRLAGMADLRWVLLNSNQFRFLP